MLLILFAALVLNLAFPARAFPPAPHHQLYGVVRDEYGTPLAAGQASIVLETPSGVRVSGEVADSLGPGINYGLRVPMDAGLTPDLYQKNAIRLSAPFRMYVVLGGVTHVPIEMRGDYALIGRPGQATRVDLTLGTDENGDGIPDAWERAFLAALDSDLDLAELHAGVDLTRAGRTLQEEYLLGAYPFNPGSSFAVRVAEVTAQGPVLEFETMTGRSYLLLGSTDLQQWSVVSFTLPTEGATGPVHSYYWAPDIRTVRVRPVVAGGEAMAGRFFRVVLQ